MLNHRAGGAWTPQHVGMLQLLLASSMWGFGFIAAKWALAGFDATWMVAFRFMISIPASLFWLGKSSFRESLNRTNFLLCFWPGLCLASTLVLQTVGLKYTSATASGFLTCLYVVMVPMLDIVIRKNPIHPITWLCVAAAFVGAVLVSGIAGAFGTGQAMAFNLGDILTVGCAVFAAGHIVSLAGPESHGADEKHPFLSMDPTGLNAMQGMWALVLILFVVPFLGATPLTMPMESIGIKAWVGLIALGVFSNLFAFGLQVSAAKKLSPTTSSLLCLLECLFSSFYAYVLLSETLDFLQWMGGLLILTSAAVAIVAEMQVQRKLQKKLSVEGLHKA